MDVCGLDHSGSQPFNLKHAGKDGILYMCFIDHCTCVWVLTMKQLSSSLH